MENDKEECPVHGLVDYFSGPMWMTHCQYCYLMQDWTTHILDIVEEKSMEHARALVRQGPRITIE